MFGFSLLKPSPKQAPTAPPAQVQLSSFIDVIFPFAAVKRKGITQFLFAGEATKSHVAVVFPKNIPTGSNSKCSISTSLMFMHDAPFKFRFVRLVGSILPHNGKNTRTAIAVQTTVTVNCLMDTAPKVVGFLAVQPMYRGSQVKFIPSRLKVRSSTEDRITEE